MIDAHAREPVHLSRADFCQAAKDLVDTLSCSSELSDHVEHLQGWVWKEDSRLANYGYLEKQGTLLQMNRAKQNSQFVEQQGNEQDSDSNDNDSEYDHLDDLVSTVSPITYAVKLFVVYSASFRVPCLLFSLHNASGAPVPLSQIQSNTHFFRLSSIPGEHNNSNDTSPHTENENASFPAVTQEQHPCLEYSCYSLHPCHTPSALAEIMSASSLSPLSFLPFSSKLSNTHALRILVTWFMITSTAVDLCPL